MIGFLTAVECGDTNQVEQLLAQQAGGGVSKMIDYRRRTALHLAVERGNEAVVEVLLCHQGSVDLFAKDCGGFTALHLAAELGHDKIVARLLEESPTLVHEKALDGLTSLHLAVIRGHVPVVQMLLATTPSLVITEDNEKRPPLHFAVEYGHNEIAAVLLASAESQMADGNKEMFQTAIRFGYDKVVSQLLDRRPQLIDVLGSDGKTPLHLAAECGRGTVVEQLFARRQPRLAEVGGVYEMNLLYFAAEYGCDTVVPELLVERPHLVDVAGDFGKTVLHIAARKGHAKIVEQLLVHKPNLIEAKDKYGKRPLHHAAIGGHEQVVEQLLAHRPAIVNLGDNRGDTALGWACYRTNPKAVASLLAHGAAVSNAMLWEAFKFGTDDSRIAEVFRLLCARKPELMGNSDDQGRSMLHHVLDSQSGEFFSEELMQTVWQLSPPQVLQATDLSKNTPFHTAILCDNKFAIGLMQSRLSLDEFVAGFAKLEKKCPSTILDKFREPLLRFLHKDAASTVGEYLGVEWPKKKL